VRVSWSAGSVESPHGPQNVPEECNGSASPRSRHRFKAVAFDGFPIIDSRPIAAKAEEIFPGKGDTLVTSWRARQTHRTPAKLCYLGHAGSENRQGLIVDARVSEANGFAERATALQMLDGLTGRRCTVGADKAYDTRGFVAQARELNITPHVAKNIER